MQSIWEKEVNMPSFPCLEGKKNVDVLIIGGGITGLLCAYFLQKYGVDYCLLEANRIAEGVTANTTAKITAQHGLIYHEIERRYGGEAAKKYYMANLTALKNYDAICKEIKCDWEKKDNYVYSVKKREKLEREMRTLEKIGANARLEEALPLPFATCGAVCFPEQAQFHPLKFLSELSKGLRIYEQTKVLKIGGSGGARDRVISTDKGTVTAKTVIVATHFPLWNKHGVYFVKLYQHRSCVLALEKTPHLPGMYADEDKKGFSFRNTGEYLLFGGSGHRTGKRGGCYTELSEAANRFYPGAELICRFAAQDCMSLDGIPYIGQYSMGCRNVLVATGFNKWGMTSSMVAAMILSDMVRGKKNEYETLFSPARSMVAVQTAVNLAESVMGLCTLSGKRCSHLGCALKWNKEEHSWDCPCHGSRFSKNGEVLDNPANRDLN